MGTGTIAFGGFTSGGLVQATAGTGVLSLYAGGIVTSVTANGSPKSGAITINNASYTSGSTVTINSASAAANGLVTTGSQTFGGAKTFNNAVTIQGLGNFSAATTGLSVTGAISASSTASLLQLGSSAIQNGNVAGTYLGINQSGTADFVHLENGGTPLLSISSVGAISSVATIATILHLSHLVPVSQSAQQVLLLAPSFLTA